MSVSVLVVSTTLSTGGAQRFTSTLLQHLDRGQFTPSLALLRPQIEYLLPDDVAVHHLNYRGVTTFFRATRNLREVIDREKPDIVLSNITATNLIAGFALRSAQHRPRWIARVGSNTLMHDGRVRLFLTRQLYSRADGLVANSQGLADELASLYRISPSRILVFGNTTDFGMIDRLAAETPAFS
ncbi:MAG: glycosyltransferase, partial [Planctomycetota bacterium]